MQIKIRELFCFPLTDTEPIVVATTEPIAVAFFIRYN